MLPHDPNTIQMAWPVGNDPKGKFVDFIDCVDVSPEGFKYDVTFQGWVWSDARKNSVQSIQSRGGISFDYAGYQDFFGHVVNDSYPNYDEAEGARRWKEHRRSLKESRVALCPESIPGVLPYRFFEAMACARVPLLVGSDYVLPFQEEIDYAKFAIFCATDRASNAGDMAFEFLKSHSDSEIVAMGRLARKSWESWLSGQDWPRTMAYAVSKKIGAPCPTAA